MDNGFRKFKRKIRTGAVIRALLTGLSVGVIAVAVQWLIAKLAAGQPDFVFYGLVGGGAFVLVTALMLLITLPTDKRLAKRLDKRLDMHEKVQTMIFFRKDTESDMVALQRENTQQILVNTPSKKARNRLAILYAILPVLACACLVVTILIPQATAAQPSGPSTSWQLNNFDEGKLRTLINYVMSSEMQTEPKLAVVEELEGLLNDLRGVEKKENMQKLVIDSIKQIHEICLVCDTYSVIIDPMTQTPSQNVNDLGQHVGTLDDSFVTTYMKKLQEETLKVDNKAEVAGMMAENMQTALEKSGQTDSNPLYAALAAFAEELAKITDETNDDALRAILKNAENDLNNAIEQPGIDLSVEKYTINMLMKIFDLETSQIPPEILASFNNSLTGSLGDSKEEEEDRGHMGGLGPGELLIGSQDQIYDPELGRYVPLAEVIQKYNALFTQYVSDGVLTPEMEEILGKYLGILMRGPGK